MKASFGLFTLLIGVFLMSSCQRATTSGYSGVVHRGHIVNSICGSITVQFTDGSNLGQSGWVDQNKTYSNVFRVANACDWNPDGLVSTGNVSFIMVSPTTQNCAQCMALGHTPEMAYSIRLVR